MSSGKISLRFGSVIYGDKAYTSCSFEDSLLEFEQIKLILAFGITSDRSANLFERSQRLKVIVDGGVDDPENIPKTEKPPERLGRTALTAAFVNNEAKGFERSFAHCIDAS